MPVKARPDSGQYLLHWTIGSGIIRLVVILWLSCGGTDLFRGLKNSALLSYYGMHHDGIAHVNGIVGIFFLSYVACTIKYSVLTDG